MNTSLSVITGRSEALLSCHACGLLTPCSSPDDVPAGHERCSRCGSALHMRYTDSLNRTWALLITAVILYIPANLLPITQTSSLGLTQDKTIMQGVIYFLQHGEWPIAVVIFTASILVPLLKMAVLLYLLISVQRGSSKRALERTKIYRIIEFIGRWSMIDIFVVVIMVALVQLGTLASIAAGEGALYFCAVVIITMFASASFDPRLIWDRCETDG
ncbi:MAG: paraquat-inducible membrane protein A [Gammaproteobacteria bacterium]|nr:paraquat-inducible membrane protein A [Gammaproteobacteria bacterium]MCP4091484.1 paraquat-inducible membrane protein A [Gammaproteobacteria bacterium]MCP4832282.1 paraquat-inducible membrane protein A [Gammaproteobacteria bacterium]MCP4928143.1 paraquat-inducible membrane protein A [Gammaproteobacteria bacterium]